MRAHRDRNWDKGVYEINIKGGERLIINSPNGEVIIDERGRDLNMFTVIEHGLIPPHWIPNDERIDIGQFVKKKYIPSDRVEYKP